jgi:hypothetical protein
LFLKLEILKKILLTVILVVVFYGLYTVLLWGQLVFSILALVINTYFAGSMIELHSAKQQLFDMIPAFF